ncbi:MAG: hypothetical protein IPK34_09470 [Ramlibacter sp.]|nr:hypothetical protein [Ramlibacter sp.]
MLLQNCRSAHAQAKGCCDLTGGQQVGLHLVVDVLRIARLGEEEPALGQQAGRLRGQRQQPGQRRAGQQRPGEQPWKPTQASALRGRGAVEELARVERAAGHAHRLAPPAPH